MQATSMPRTHASNLNAKAIVAVPREEHKRVDERSPILPEGNKKTSEGFPYPGAPEAIC